jgi:adenylylsulfate kinase
MNKRTMVLWFTGLSGSGKSTVVDILIGKIKEDGKSCVVFDGDDVRNRLHKHLGFSTEDIKENNRLIAELCRGEIGKTDFILVPIISPFRESRRAARELFGENFLEIYFNCPYKECKKRDVKGLYKKAHDGEIENFIGLHIPYEFPENPDIEIESISEEPEESAEKILSCLDIRNK